MKVKLSFFRTLLMLMMLMAFSPISRATCIPAPDPDLNNDGIVNSADLVIVTRSNGVAKGNPRYNLNPLADTNCDGKINPVDIHYVNKAFGQTFPIPSNLNVTGTLDAEDSVSFRLGNDAEHTVMFTLSSSSHTPFSVRIAQSIQPATGLVLSPVLNGTEVFDDDGDGYIGDNIGQAVTASVPGEYTITTTATVIGTSKVFTHTAHVKVYGENEPFLSVSINIPGPFGEKLPVNTTQNILPIRVNVGGDDKGLVSQVKVKQLETGEIRILGASQSGNPFDYGYSTEVRFDTTQAGRCYTYVALAETSKGTVQSERTEKICVTSFSIGYVHPTSGNLWAALVPDIFYANNLLIVKIKPGTTENRVREIATLVNARVVGQDLYGSTYQIQLLSPPNILKGLEDVAKSLHQFPEVISVEVYGKSKALSSIADDSLFLAGYQPNLNSIRADEAWWVTGGISQSPTIAVLDSGVHSNHPDLSGKVKEGADFLNLLFDIDGLIFGLTTADVESHGTHVAGIAAAKTNNTIGIAGVSRNSSILPVRVADATRSIYYADMAASIKWAAAHDGKIINASIGVPADAGIIGLAWCGLKYKLLTSESCTIEEAISNICDAVEFAKTQNAIVIGAAGNSGADVKNYPAACTNAVGVGAIDKAENKAGFSNFGNWVYLAAPGGERILSTVPFDLRSPEAIDIDYDFKRGTSQATPHVSGALAVLLTRHPEWQANSETMKMAVNRLRRTAKPLPGQGLGNGRIDLFEAVFNGSFEIIKAKSEQPVEWKQHPNITGICSSKTETLGILPVATANNKHMLVCDNTSVVSAGVMNEIDIPDGVTELPISFDWRIVAEDLNMTGLPGGYVWECGYDFVYIPYYPYYEYQYTCGYVFELRNDRVVVELVKEDGTNSKTVFLKRLTFLDKASLSPYASNSWLGNNWQSVTATVPVLSAGKYQLKVRVEQSLDSNGIANTSGTTLFMMDKVRFR